MAPEQIGRYQIKSELGRGGMATVYHAYDPSFERDVAIKVLPRAFLHDPQFRVRFEREAKTVAALEHSAIVPVYDFGEDDGQPFIVMRMMSGGDLADKLKDGKLSIKEATQVITRLGAALDAAHAKGIIHRDMKPGNILFDQYDNAYLSDFGIARLTHGGHTLTGENIIGTPTYMSPEQVQGEKDLDGRSDLYSLGIIFYQMLTGHVPYQATTPAKVMMMHILEPVPSLENIQPQLPVAVSTWLQKLLSKDPDDRFATAEEMVEALQAAMRGEKHPTLSARPITVTKPSVQPPVATPVHHPPPSAVAPHTPAPTPISYPAVPVGKPKRNWLPIAIGGFILLGLGAVLVLATAFMGYRGQGPLAMLASPTATDAAEITTAPPETETALTPGEVVAADASTLTPTPELITTEAPPTSTPEPSATPTPEIPVIGGADKIAFLESNDIWLMNVDGSELTQLTNDGAVKTNLSWTPDGSALTYISGKCIWYAEWETGRLDFIACFEAVEFLESFAISPDGTRAAIALNRELYIVPYDRERLTLTRFRTDLQEMSECEAFDPMLTSTNAVVNARIVRWSNDGQRLSIMLLAALGGLQGDLIRVYEIGNCQNLPNLVDEFPATRFTVENYDDSPTLQNFGYDGDYLYALTSYTRNDGYGQLYLYNGNLHRAETKANPIDGTCCYRDPQFSPDGRYLIFAYQPFEAGATSQLYLVPYGTIGTGASYDPLPLPEDFFTDPRAQPLPVLRPATTGE